MLKIGDKVKFKKLSRKKFEKIYESYYFYAYEGYLKQYDKFFDKKGCVTELDNEFTRVRFDNGRKMICYSEELIKISMLPDKIKVIRKLFK
jgi:hypothetical protein